MEPREPLVSPDLLEPLVSPDQEEELDPMALRELRVPVDSPEIPDPLVSRETPAPRESLATPDPREPLAPLVRRAREEPPVRLVPPALLVSVEPEVPLELVDCLDLREEVALLVCPETVVLPAPLEPVDPLVMPVVLESLV